MQETGMGAGARVKLIVKCLPRCTAYVAWSGLAGAAVF